MEATTKPFIPSTENKYFNAQSLKLIKMAHFTVRSVNNKIRRLLLDLLNERGETCVTEIYTTLRIEQSVASQHLAILRREGIVKRRLEGKHKYYSIDHDRVKELMTLFSQLIKH